MKRLSSIAEALSPFRALERLTSIAFGAGGPGRKIIGAVIYDFVYLRALPELSKNGEALLWATVGLVVVNGGQVILQAWIKDRGAPQPQKSEPSP